MSARESLRRRAFGVGIEVFAYLFRDPRNPPIGWNGFRAWTQTLNDEVVECPCHMAWADLRGLKHYRRRDCLPEFLHDSDQATIASWILAAQEIQDAHRDGLGFKQGLGDAINALAKVVNKHAAFGQHLMRSGASRDWQCLSFCRR